MKSTRFLGLVCISFAVFALPAAAQTPDGVTPSRDSTCDGLDGTPGLKGLCVAMCEAQDCGGVLDPVNGEVTFDDSCKRPSSDRLLANYRKAAGDPYAAPPCIRVPCPCWSESEIDSVGGGEFFGLGDSCTRDPDGLTVTLFGFSDSGKTELAYALENGNGLECMYQEEHTPGFRDEIIGAALFDSCRKSVMDEIASRGLTCN